MCGEYRHLRRKVSKTGRGCSSPAGSYTCWYLSSEHQVLHSIGSARCVLSSRQLEPGGVVVRQWGLTSPMAEICKADVAAMQTDGSLRWSSARSSDEQLKRCPRTRLPRIQRSPCRRPKRIATCAVLCQPACTLLRFEEPMLAVPREL